MLFLRRPGGYTVEHTKCVTWFFLHLNLEKMKLRSNYFLIFLALPLALSAQEQPASSPVAQHPAIARFQNSHPYLALPPDWTPYAAFRAPARQQAANAPTLSWQLYPRNPNPVFTPALMVPFNKQGRYYDRNPVSFQPTKCDKFWGTTAKVIGISLWFLGNNDRQEPLCDLISGGCFDGLNPAMINQNQGAESTICWLHSLLRMMIIRQELKIMQ